jgi:hypothetical protein
VANHVPILHLWETQLTKQEEEAAEASNANISVMAIFRGIKFLTDIMLLKHPNTEFKNVLFSLPLT